jgi:class 3 adenylate cyclase/tetratricopeptide (TPR) repeat protein
MNDHEILKRIIPYVPPYWVRQALNDPERTLVGREERIYAAVLFVDISGFTTISEALSRKGRKGKEELSALLDRYFTVMAEPVAALGGEVVKFAGDALIVAFAAQWDSGDAHLGSAIECALRMQNAMVEFAQVRTTTGTFPLQMKIGIGEGAIYNTTVGDEEGEMQPVFAGHPLALCQQAEDRASAGEIVTDAALVNRMRRQLDTGEAREAFRPVLGATDLPVLSPVGQPDVTMLEPQRVGTLIRRLSSYLPRQVVERIRQGRRGVYGEHRRVTVMFVKFGGLNYDWEPQVGHVLQVYFTAMHNCIARYGGRINEVDIGSSGGTLVVFFGAPTSHEDDELRAVSCAWEMQQAVADVRVRTGTAAERLRQCIGVSSGILFVGDVGAAIRRTYAAVGEEVIVASRLMNLAQWGEVVVTRWVQKHTAGRFDYEAMGEVRVKGKVEPVPVFALLAPLLDPSASGLFSHLMDRRRLVGRDTELAIVHAVRDRAWQGEPHLLLVTGEAGVGKSRLAGELAQEWIARGGFVYVGDCHQQGDEVAYSPWVDLLRAVFGLRKADLAEHQREKIESQLVLFSPDLVGRGTIFHRLLDVTIAQDSPSSLLSPGRQRVEQHRAVIDLFQSIARRHPLCLVLENFHDIDRDSLALLNELMARLKNLPFLICAPYRPPLDLPLAEDAVSTMRLMLGELTEQDSIALARQWLEDAGLLPDLAPQVVVQAQGNPFYVQEVVRALADAEDAGAALSAGMAVPESISDLIQAQVDRLDEDTKLTLRIAAIIGDRFDLEVLRVAHPVPVSPLELKARLEALERALIVQRDHGAEACAGGTCYLFRQTMTRQVIYARLLSVDRERFHRRVGEALAKTYAGDLEERYELLADHFYRGNERSKATAYLLKAGQREVRSLAYSQALLHYNQAEEVLATCDVQVCRPQFVHKAQLTLLLQRGDVWRRLAGISGAIADYNRAARLAGDLADLETQGKALLYMGDIALCQARYPESQFFIRQAMQRFSVLENAPLTARSLLLIGQTYALQGHFEDAQSYFGRAADIAEGLSDPTFLARCRVGLGLVEFSIGKVSLALDTLQRAIELGRKLGAQSVIAEGVTRLAEVLLYRGRWGRALQLAHEAESAVRELGDCLSIAGVQRVLGLVLTRIGAYEEACVSLDQALPVLKDAGWCVELVAGLWVSGEALLALGRYEKASERYYQALTLGQKSNTIDAVVHARLGLSKLAAVERNWAEEQRLCNEARALARRADMEPMVIAARVGLARAYLGRREWRSAQREALMARDGSYRLGSPYDAFRAEAMLGEALIGLAYPERAQQHFREAGTMIRRLADTLPDPYKGVFLDRPYVSTVLRYARGGGGE